MFTWLLPLVGIPVTVVGIALSVRSRSRGGGTFSTVGLVLSVISAVLVAINFAVGFYIGYTRALHH